MSEMNLTWYYVYFFLLLVIHFSLYFLLRKRIGNVLTGILILTHLFYSCVAFWELYTTTLYLIIPEGSNFLFPINARIGIQVGFFTLNSLPLYLLGVLFYRYYLIQNHQYTKIRLVGVLLLMLSMQFSIVGDFGYFILRGLEYFTPSFATWLLWVGPIAFTYVFQLFWCFNFLITGYLCFQLSNLKLKK